MAAAIAAKISSGGYASVIEVLRDGVGALMERDDAIDKWLREEVSLGHQEYLADPSLRSCLAGWLPTAFFVA